MTSTLTASATRAALLSVLFLASAAFAQSSAPTAPSFTADQAAKGKALYQKHCAVCHGAQLEGEQVSPPLKGARFDQSWRGKSAAVIGFHLRRMPPEPADNPGGLGDETYTNILAFLLQSNGLAASDTPLPSDLASLAVREGVREHEQPIVAA